MTEFATQYIEASALPFIVDDGEQEVLQIRVEVEHKHRRAVANQRELRIHVRLLATPRRVFTSQRSNYANSMHVHALTQRQVAKNQNSDANQIDHVLARITL